ncbi:hypothetical protein EVAR_39121_1 [Eumeta japonica]|uniref:Uncharacterized protein n=1 Tax=Eumeta variegata TaxID=151549 RepID=A0A4C1X3Y7_EUMVA|nr:hypothetical protein EVAR_39121_1 [Eumeta japonica]
MRSAVYEKHKRYEYLALAPAHWHSKKAVSNWNSAHGIDKSIKVSMGKPHHTSNRKQLGSKGTQGATTKRTSSEGTAPAGRRRQREGGGAVGFTRTGIVGHGNKSGRQSLAQELEMERKSRQQAMERDVKSPLSERAGYYKNSVLFSSAT